jgi:hypothetical protein
VNSLYDGEEGEYPPEVENPWVTFTIRKNIKKPWAYQFTGMGNNR